MKICSCRVLIETDSVRSPFFLLCFNIQKLKAIEKMIKCGTMKLYFILYGKEIRDEVSI